MFLLPGWEFGLAAFTAVWEDQAGAAVAAIGNHSCTADGGLRAGELPCLQSLRLPGRGLPITTTSRVSASMTTWWLVEQR